MPTYVCFSDLFSVPCSKSPSKYFSEGKKVVKIQQQVHWRTSKSFVYFPKIWWCPGPKSRMCCEVHFGQGLHVCPGESQDCKKNCIFMHNKYKMVNYKQNFGREQSRGPKKWGRTRNEQRMWHARSHGHMLLPKMVAIQDIPLNQPT